MTIPIKVYNKDFKDRSIENEMNSYKELKTKIEKKKAKICIVGLGYVGLPLAVAFSQKGYFVYGFDTSASRIKKLTNGDKYIVDVNPKDVLALISKNKFLPTLDKRVMRESDVVIVCVPTPLRKVKIPDISYVVNASKTIAKHLRKGQLVVLESTSYPTTTKEVMLPELKKSGLIEEKDFFLCFSPERVNPGDKKFPLTKIAKVVGGLSKKSSELSRSLYSKIIKNIFVVSSPEAAETTKLLENTFRLVNIALANEFSIVCNKMGVDIWEVIEAAKTKPFGFMPFYPGPGVGGHCLPCDPVYLSWKAKKLGFKTKMIDIASSLNRYMPLYITERTISFLKRTKKALKQSKILILGVTYKKDVKDLRESPALDIIESLSTKKIKVDYYDPLVPYLKMGNIDLKRINLTAINIKKYDCVVLVTNHSKVNYSFIRKNAKCIFDTRNVYKKKHDNVVTL